MWYCWWKKSQTTTCYFWNLANNGTFTISTGFLAGFLVAINHMSTLWASLKLRPFEAQPPKSHSFNVDSSSLGLAWNWGMEKIPSHPELIEFRSGQMSNTRWWLQTCFMFSTWGRWTQFDEYFFKWVGSTTNQNMFDYVALKIREDWCYLWTNYVFQVGWLNQHLRFSREKKTF